MTLQISTKYDLLYEEGALRLFNPLDIGFETYSKSSMCWSGHMCVYKVKNNELYLDRLDINSENKIKINGKEPSRVLSILTYLKDIFCFGFDYTYKNIKLKLNYTGEILIGKGNVENDFDNDYYYDECLMSPHSYEEVLKLKFKNGKLITVTNISNELDGLRKRIRKKYQNTNQNVEKYEKKKVVNLKSYNDFWE